MSYRLTSLMFVYFKDITWLNMLRSMNFSGHYIYIFNKYCKIDIASVRKLNKRVLYCHTIKELNIISKDSTFHIITLINANLHVNIEVLMNLEE